MPYNNNNKFCGGGRSHDLIPASDWPAIRYGNKLLLYPNLRLIPLYSKKIRAIVLEYSGIGGFAANSNNKLNLGRVMSIV